MNFGHLEFVRLSTFQGRKMQLDTQVQLINSYRISAEERHMFKSYLYYLAFLHYSSDPEARKP